LEGKRRMMKKEEEEEEIPGTKVDNLSSASQVDLRKTR
jgi:hypothetical protein